MFVMMRLMMRLLAAVAQVTDGPTTATATATDDGGGMVEYGGQHFCGLS